MTDSPSFVARGERADDDLRALWKRRKALCVILLFAVCIPTILLIADRFWGHSKIESDLRVARENLQEVTEDRNAKATQLAPFLALANSRYENAPEGKRLELLVDRLEAATKTLLRAATSTSKRQLSAVAEKQLLERLDFAKPVPISITSPIGIDNTAELGEQLHNLFEKAGFKVDVSFGLFTKQPVGLMVEATPPLPPELEDALLLIFKELGEEPKFYRAADSEKDKARVKIIIGSRPTADK